MQCNTITNVQFQEKKSFQCPDVVADNDDDDESKDEESSSSISVTVVIVKLHRRLQVPHLRSG